MEIPNKKAVAGDVTGKSFYARLGKVALDGWVGVGKLRLGYVSRHAVKRLMSRCNSGETRHVGS